MQTSVQGAVVVEVKVHKGRAQGDHPCGPRGGFGGGEVEREGLVHGLPFKPLRGPRPVPAMARQCFHVFSGVRPWFVPHQGLQLPMGHEVGIASNRTGEVRIGVEVKSEMTGVGGGVARPLHQLEEALVHHASRCPGQLTRRMLGLAQGVEHGSTGLWINHFRPMRFLGRLGVGFDGDAARPTRQQVGQLLR